MCSFATNWSPGNENLTINIENNQLAAKAE